MSKILFIGDSHSMGYVDTDYNNIEDGFKIWQSHNYAEIYSKNNNVKVIIMASSGCGNREYVNFLAQAFKKYNDISEVYIQSTYWGRFPIAINPSLNEKEIFPLDFFIEQNISSELIDRYSIGLVQKQKYLQNYYKPEVRDYNIEYIKTTNPGNLPSLRHSSYMYIKMYHYLQTHLEQQDYFKDIALCDALCYYNNVKLHIWNINDRCFIPTETKNFYTPLKSTNVADIDAISFISKKFNKDFSTETLDGEHYTENVHKLIAENYIPYLRNQQWKQ